NRGPELAHFHPPALAYQQSHPEPDPPTPVQPERGTPIDYNHDGLTDVFLHDVHGTYGTWGVLLAQPDRTFTRHDTGVQRKYPLTTGSEMAWQSSEAAVHLADVDGDG